ncbi:2-oxo acid dehydrogenase subunit E2 [bacterium]|nr:MAG: 2-oxo acid dehydrogenase subunit E2 [bacterium]
MSRALPMPKLGLTMTSGVVSKWHKAAGEHVDKGEPLVEVATDKIAFEYESPFEGVLERIEAAEGSELEPGATIAYFSGEGEQVAAVEPVQQDSTRGECAGTVQATEFPRTQHSGASDTSRGECPGTVQATGSPRTQHSGVSDTSRGECPGTVQATGSPRTQHSGVSGARVVASPVARRAARERGVDLHAVHGTGPRGRITLDDVLAVPISRAPVTEIPTGVRGAIYRHMSEVALLPVADVSTEIDATELAALIARRAGVSWTAAAALAVARALRDHPAVSEGKASDVGIAVDTDAGLMVPVVRNCEARDLRSISAEIGRLAALARQGRLGPDDVAGGVISISNVGPAGIARVRPLPNAPQRAILGMGAALERPWLREGQIVPARVLQLVLSFDHRWIDGAPAARFLAQVAAYLTSPLEML